MSYSMSPGAQGARPVTSARSWLLAANATSSWDLLAEFATGRLAAQSGLTSDPYYADLHWHGRVPDNVRALPALKFVVLVPRPEHVAAPLFHQHWLERHSQLVRAAAAALRIKRYVQSHVIASPTIDSFASGRDWTANPYSGMTECWWESEEAMAQAFHSKEGQEASRMLAEDERRTVDSRVIVWAAREYEIFDFNKE